MKFSFKGWCNNSKARADGKAPVCIRIRQGKNAAKAIPLHKHIEPEYFDNSTGYPLKVVGEEPGIVNTAIDGSTHRYGRQSPGYVKELEEYNEVMQKVLELMRKLVNRFRAESEARELKGEQAGGIKKHAVAYLCADHIEKYGRLISINMDGYLDRIMLFFNCAYHAEKGSDIPSEIGTKIRGDFEYRLVDMLKEHIYVARPLYDGNWNFVKLSEA